MIKHIVMRTIRDTGSPRSKLETMAEMKSRLLAMKNEIQEIKKTDVHFNSVSTPQDNYEVILESEFVSWADLDICQKHPAHLVVKDFVRNVSRNRASIDYEF